MAFDRPMEADSVDDLGFVTSLIRAPVVGIMWLLGGDQAKQADSDGGSMQAPELDQDDLIPSSGAVGVDADKLGCAAAEYNDSVSRETESHEEEDDDPGGGASAAMNTAPQAQGIEEVADQDKENEDPSPLQEWPSVGLLDSADDVSTSYAQGEQKHKSIEQPPQDRDSSSQMMDDLVTAMSSSHITSQPQGPASAVLSASQSKTTSSSTNSLTASYSASTFPNHSESPILPTHSQRINSGRGIAITRSTSTGKNGSSSGALSRSDRSDSLRGSKKMSWSDECGSGPLVEYHDDTAVPVKSKHWSSMRRNRRNSYDGSDKSINGSGTRRGEVKVIKSALKRSGSYSPPVTFYGGNNARSVVSTSTSTDSSCSESPHPGMRSYRSISVIGSSDDDSLRAQSSDHLNEQADISQDSMAALTQKKLNAHDKQCVPSTLQVGCGRASGGLIIPRGGPTDYFPRDDPRYQLALGAGAQTVFGKRSQVTPVQSKDEDDEEEKSPKEETNAKVVGGSHNLANGRHSPGHHHFLPRQNGYISPQYGFYVNITPPTPEMYAASHPTQHKVQGGDKPPKSSVQQQSYQQFQYQSKYTAPSPIPEGIPAGGSQGIPSRFVGRSSVPRPSSHKRSSSEGVEAVKPHVTPSGRRFSEQSTMKPAFTKNKKGMGMLLAENPHHGVWPSVPFG